MQYLIIFALVWALWSCLYLLASRVIVKRKVQSTKPLPPLLRFVVRVLFPFIRLSSFGESAETEVLHKKQSPIVNEEAPNDVYEEHEMLDEIIHFYNKKVNEIMTPRTDIQAINITSDIDSVVAVIVESGYSRLPVYIDAEDNIRGVLYVKDIIPALGDKTGFEWQKLIREPFYVPESKKIYDLLNELRANRTHIAIVVDEFGCASGLVTMEDIIEEIIGDISDEYDDDRHSFVELADGSYIFEGKTQLNDFFRKTGVQASDFSEHTEEAETLTGLLLAIKGTLPHRRDVIDYKNYRFRILEADDRRVLKIKFSINRPNDSDKK